MRSKKLITPLQALRNAYAAGATSDDDARNRAVQALIAGQWSPVFAEEAVRKAFAVHFKIWEA